MYKPFELNFNEYIRHVEPSKQEKGKAWAMAIGLQQVDGLTPSPFLYETARRNIEGEISVDEAKTLVDNYYESRTERTPADEGTEEADKVASRIVQILSEPSFNFSPSYFIAIHKRLFQDIYRFAGKLRDYDITKKEWVLDGDTVMYGAAFELQSALDYDFQQERNFKYENLSQDELIQHICFFVSRLWQIHAFGEGNTRTTAVFTIKYLRSLGFSVDNEPFEANSWYFRNSLVRANYKNVHKGIQETMVYLERFFRNLLLKENHQLKNRYLHILAAEILPANPENLPANGENLPTNPENLPANPESLPANGENLPTNPENLPANPESLPANGENLPTNPENLPANSEDLPANPENLPTNPESLPANGENLPINTLQQDLLRLLLENPLYSYDELSQKLSRTRETVRVNLRKLQGLQLIKRVGATKNGHWEVLLPK